MREIPLQKGVAAWVDDSDFERFGHLKWRLHSNGHAIRDGEKLTGRKGVVYLPRIIVAATASQKVRPRNHVKLDCRRENLLVEREPMPKTNSHEENMSALVLRFLRAFPQQARFPLPTIRRQLEEVRDKTLMTTEEFLTRIEGWAAARRNIAPWDLEKPAPVLKNLTPETRPQRPTIILPEPSVKTREWVRAMHTQWESDGTI